MGLLFLQMSLWNQAARILRRTQKLGNFRQTRAVVQQVIQLSISQSVEQFSAGIKIAERGLVVAAAVAALGIGVAVAGCADETSEHLTTEIGRHPSAHAEANSRQFWAAILNNKQGQSNP